MAAEILIIAIGSTVGLIVLVGLIYYLCKLRSLRNALDEDVELSKPTLERAISKASQKSHHSAPAEDSKSNYVDIGETVDVPNAR